MHASPVNCLIESLIDSLTPEGAGPRERYLLRQSLLALARQARVEQMAQVRADALWLAGGDRIGQECPQQACRDHGGIGVDDPVRQRA